jgi:hypothetical protein
LLWTSVSLEKSGSRDGIPRRERKKVVVFGNLCLVWRLTNEPQSSPTQAYSGMGCRPTRSWVFNKLREGFKHVYMPKTQPCHAEFPLDWSAPEKHTAPLQRAIFIASHEPLENDMLTSSLLMEQTRQM